MFSPATTICEARAVAVRFSLGFETGGEDFNSRFFLFDEEPFAAASIAQVHHALLRDHQEVAVKVQYPGLEYQMKFDLATMSFLSKSVA
nr:uncharacterized aarF domain-containing protein kinase 1-like [Ipomoea trifida]